MKENAPRARREKTHGFGKFARARLAAHDDDILIYINFAFFLCLKMEKIGKLEKMFKTHQKNNIFCVTEHTTHEKKKKK